MDLSPDVLRGAQFTERFRGYDAAEVDSFLNAAADALDELLSEASAPMVAVAAERARGAIEEVRRGGLAEVQDLHRQRDDLEAAVAELRRVLLERRQGVVAELELIDSALEEVPDTAGAGTSGADNSDESGADRAGSDADTFLARLEQAATEGGGADDT